MRFFNAVHGINQPAVFKPLQGEFVIFEACAFLHIGEHEFFVFLGKLLRQRVPQRTHAHHQARVVDVFGKIVFIRQ